MRRTLAGLVAFLAFTGVVLVLPVYAAPLPEVRPVETAIDEIELGSVAEPEGDAVVTQDGAVQPGGVDADGPAETGPVPVPEAEDVAESGAEIPGVPALTISRPDTDPFETVGVTWRDDPAVGDVTVQLRVEQADGSWGEWTTLATDDIEQTASPKTADREVRAGTAPYWTGRASGVEVVVQGTGEVAPEDVTLALLDPGTSPADTMSAGVGPRDQANAAGAMPRIYSRAEWGADESIRTWDPEYAATVKAATVHHTADSNNYSAADVPAMMRSIYAYHTKTRGWGDIGYNVVVDRFGRIFEGRAGGLQSTVVGAHAGGFNNSTFGVSMLGDYDAAPVPQATVDAVADVIAWKFSLFGVDPAGTTVLTSGGGGTARYPAGTKVTLPTIFGHRDVGSTTCPGKYGYARLNDVRAGVAARLPGYQEPTGSLDAVTPGEGMITIAGWTFDADRPTTSLAVHVYVDGVFSTAVLADRYRGDVATAYPWVGAAHGYWGVLTAAPGSREVCAYAINVGSGTRNTGLGCRRVTVEPVVHEPRGALEQTAVLGQSVTYAGWALDRDVPQDPVTVHLYLDGRFAAATVADGQRTDIAERYPTGGARRGFSGTLAVTPGQHTLCAFGINVGAGSGNSLLSCSTFTVGGVEALNPFGSLDAVTVDAGRVYLAGWAIDPDRPTSTVPVHLYADGRFFAAVGTDRYRPDLPALYPAAGPVHGYAAEGRLDEGRHTICAYAINAGGGTGNSSLGCLVADVPVGTWVPFGSVDTAVGDGRVARVTGWAIDPDVTSAWVGVHVYVDGEFAMASSASDWRGDVAAVHPGAGARHGYDLKVPVRAGSRQVCVFAINQSWGSVNPLLGCRTATTSAAAYNPVGTLDVAWRTGSSIDVAGWAYDPDQPDAPLAVHVYVDGAPEVALSTGASRSDVAAAVPGAGARTGFTGTVAVRPGVHEVCAYAINAGDGQGNPRLGCLTVDG